MSHRNGRPRGGITYRQAGAAGILWALTAGICNLLGGCGTIEGVGRDLQTSSRMVRQWWSGREGAKVSGVEVSRGDRDPFEMEVSLGEGGGR